MNPMNILNCLPKELLVGINEYAQDKDLKKKMLKELVNDAIEHQHIFDWSRCAEESGKHKICWEISHRNKYNSFCGYDNTSSRNKYVSVRWS